jgi:hypothetical protein
MEFLFLFIFILILTTIYALIPSTHKEKRYLERDSRIKEEFEIIVKDFGLDLDQYNSSYHLEAYGMFEENGVIVKMSLRQVDGHEHVTYQVSMLASELSGLTIRCLAEAAHDDSLMSRRVKTGDKAFDGVVVVVGELERALSLLDEATRDALRERWREISLAQGRLTREFRGTLTRERLLYHLREMKGLKALLEKEGTPRQRLLKVLRDDPCVALQRVILTSLSTSADRDDPEVVEALHDLLYETPDDALRYEIAAMMRDEASAEAMAVLARRSVKMPCGVRALSLLHELNPGHPALVEAVPWLLSSFGILERERATALRLVGELAGPEAVATLRMLIEGFAPYPELAAPCRAAIARLRERFEGAMGGLELVDSSAVGGLEAISDAEAPRGSLSEHEEASSLRRDI